MMYWVEPHGIGVFEGLKPSMRLITNIYREFPICHQCSKGFLCVILFVSLTNYFSITLLSILKLSVLNLEKLIKTNLGLKEIDQFTHIRSLTGEMPVDQMCYLGVIFFSSSADIEGASVTDQTLYNGF